MKTKLLQQAFPMFAAGLVALSSRRLSAPAAVSLTLRPPDCPAASPTGAHTLHASGVSNSRKIVGTYLDFSVEFRGFFLASGVITTIDVAGATRVEVDGINSAGQIVGNYDDAGGVGHSFVLANGVLTTIAVPGSTNTYATGINTRGDIVGSYTDSAGMFHGFLAQG